MAEKEQIHSDGKNKTEKPGRKLSIIIIAVFVITVGIIIGIPYYNIFVAPWHEMIVQVGDTTYDMRYYIKRLRLQITAQSKNQLEIATRVLQDIQNQELVRQEAIKRKISVSDQELEKEIKRRVEASATGEGEFDELLASMLRGLRLKEKEFREWVKFDLFRVKLLQSIMSRIPKAVEHVQTYAIVVGTIKKAEEVRVRLANGEDFQQVAREVSIDLKSAKKGGEIGWMPKDVNDLEASGQIHAMGILTKTEEEAEKIRERILAGEEIKDLAKLNSLDDQSRGADGNLGWVSIDPRGGKQYAAEAYDELAPGELSKPIKTYAGFWVIKMIDKSPEGKVIDDIAFNLPIDQVTPPLKTARGYYLLKVAAKDDAHPLSKEHSATLLDKAYKEWLATASSEGSKAGRIKWNWGSVAFGWAMNHLE